MLVLHNKKMLGGDRRQKLNLRFDVCSIFFGERWTVVAFANKFLLLPGELLHCQLLRICARKPTRLNDGLKSCFSRSVPLQKSKTTVRKKNFKTSREGINTNDIQGVLLHLVLKPRNDGDI